MHNNLVLFIYPPTLGVLSSFTCSKFTSKVRFENLFYSHLNAISLRELSWLTTRYILLSDNLSWWRQASEKVLGLRLNHSCCDGFGRGYGCSLGFGLMDGRLPIESRESWTGKVWYGARSNLQIWMSWLRAESPSPLLLRLRSPLFSAFSRSFPHFVHDSRSSGHSSPL